MSGPGIGGSGACKDFLDDAYTQGGDTTGVHAPHCSLLQPGLSGGFCIVFFPLLVCLGV